MPVLEILQEKLAKTTTLTFSECDSKGDRVTVVVQKRFFQSHWSHCTCCGFWSVFFLKTSCYFVLVSRSMALKESFTYYTKAALSIPQMITSTPSALLIQLSRVRSTLNLLQYWVAQGYGLSWSKETICWVWGKVMLHFVQMASLVRLR